MSEAELALVERSENHIQTETTRVPHDWFDRPAAAKAISSEAIRKSMVVEEEPLIPNEISGPGQKFLSGFVTDTDLDQQLFTPDQIAQLAAGLVQLRGPLVGKEVPRDYQRMAEILLGQDGSVRRVREEVFPEGGASAATNALVALQKKCKTAAKDGISIDRLMRLGDPEREVQITRRVAHELGGTASVAIIVQPHSAPTERKGAEMLPSTGLPERQRSWDDYDPDEPLAWQGDGLCAQTDPEAFFPEKGGSTRDAKKICSECEVRDICLEYALQNDERFGIWGGLSERERRKLKKRVA